MNILVFYGIVAFISISITGLSLRGRVFSGGLLASILAVYVRITPNLGDHMYWWHDGYFYFSVVQSILQTHRLSVPANISAWYSGASSQMSWFAMHSIVAKIGILLGIENNSLLRNLSPSLLGLILFVLLFAAYRPLLGSRWAVVAAHLCTTLDVVVFYQTEYHAQAMGGVLIAFILLILLLVNSTVARVTRRGLFLGMMTIPVLVLSHHFSSVMILLFLSVFAISLIIGESLSKVTPPGLSSVILLRFLIPLIVCTLAFSLFVNNYILNRAASGLTSLLLQTTPQETSPFLQTNGKSIIGQLGTVVKVILALLALPAVIRILREKKRVETFYALALGSAGIAAVATLLVLTGQLTRVIILGYIPLVPIAVETIRRLADSEGIIAPQISQLIVAITIGLLAVSSLSAAYSPSLIDHSSDIRTDGYHNVEPIGDQGPQTGFWIRDFIPPDEKIKVTFKTRMVANYYGEVPLSKVSYMSPNSDCRELSLFDTARQPSPEVPYNVFYTSGRSYISNRC